VPARALELGILTSTRSGETIIADWAEFDLDAATWKIPSARKKSGKEHVVPLSTRAIQVLKQLHEQRLSSCVFPDSAPRRPISKSAMLNVLRALDGCEYTIHGFRSSFRDWVGDQTNFPRNVAEMALAHKVGDATEQAYRRASALAKRRKLMEAWAQYVSTAKGAGIVSRLEVVK
jgi:integrase